MLNEDKIKLMAGIALYEKKEGKKIFPVNRYFKSDYISSHMIRSFLSYSFCYVLCAAILALYNVDMIFNSLNTDDLLHVGLKGLVLYVAGLMIYELITFRVYNIRYEKAKRGTKLYMNKLKRLEKRYEFQNKTRELVKEGRRT